MQWNDKPFAGFSEAEPWLPLADDAGTCNVVSQQQDPQSLLNLCRDLIRTRRLRRALRLGTYRPIEASGNLLLFARELAGERLVVALNFGTSRFTLGSPGLHGRIIVASGCNREGEAVRDSFVLQADEGLVIELAPDARAPVRMEFR